MEPCITCQHNPDHSTHEAVIVIDGVPLCETHRRALDAQGLEYKPMDIVPSLQASATEAAALDQTVDVKEAVNHPSHYGGGDNPYETIKVLTAWGLDKDAHLWNAVKYISRAGKKDPDKEIEDLEKVRFYLDYAIAQRKAKKGQKARGKPAR